MIAMWIILITLSIVVLVWFIVASINGNEGSVGGSLLCAFLLGVFGWLILGNVITVGSEIQKINTEKINIVKTQNEILVTDISRDVYYIFNKKIDFDNITDTTTFYYDKGINMYGGISDRDIFYYTFKENIQKMDSVIVVENKKMNIGEAL